MDEAAFDKLMKLVGDEGKFQKRFYLIFNVGLVLCASMAYMNIVLAMNVPNHWCHVPGREFTNFSIEKWRNITLPKVEDNRAKISPSSCYMYNTSHIKPNNITENTDFGPTILHCIHGYEYDREYFKETVVSQENWVCDRELYVANTFVLNRLGEVIGTFVVGQLGDTLGRRFVYYLSLFTVIFGRLLATVTSKDFLWFSIGAVVDSLTSTSVFQSTLIIAMEISKADNRARIAMLQCIGWTVGMCIMPMIFWAVGDWVWFLLLSTLPGVIFFFFPKYMIESPRWLANKNKFSECAKQLQVIAKINNVDAKINENTVKEYLPKNRKVETVYGTVSLFSSWRLAKNTILMIILWSFTCQIYFVLILNASRMHGNPFVNFLWQSAIELPAYIVGQKLGDKLGRRFTNVLSFGLAAIAGFVQIFVITNYDILASAIAIFMKFWVSVTYLVVNLQAMETYPTCLRQTGIAIGCIIANSFGLIGPYIVHMGTKYDVRYPYMILTILSISAGIVGLFLPETLHKKLPETLVEAQVFGADQKFWSFPSAPQEEGEDWDESIEKLNQKIATK